MNLSSLTSHPLACSLLFLPLHYYSPFHSTLSFPLSPYISIHAHWHTAQPPPRFFAFLPLALCRYSLTSSCCFSHLLSHHIFSFLLSITNAFFFISFPVCNFTFVLFHPHPSATLSSSSFRFVTLSVSLLLLLPSFSFL